MTAVVAIESVRSPEGIDLQFQRAAASERLVALSVDLGILITALLLYGLVSAMVAGIGGVLLVAFFLRHGYFVWFETRWGGRTPGKRLLHLRVIRADGGPLTIETLLARNLTREVELFLPLTILFAPQVLFADHSGVLRLTATLWILLLLFFPLTNRHRLRIGDLLAGTRVVVSPPAVLGRDLADTAARPSARDVIADAGFHFTGPQLSIYGEHELSVLEGVLRKTRGKRGDKAVEAVAASIARRIGGIDLATLEDRHLEFLRDFYRAQRGHLEHQLQLGQRRLRKNVPPGRRP
jgi:uncharacterized RDD family membrane protein YckC